MEYKQLLKMLAGAVIFTLMVLAITLMLPGTSRADMDSDTRNPGVDKQESVIEQKISEFGTAMKGWAMAFGADIKQQQIRNLEQTREALKRDWSWSEGGRFTYPIKNAWEDARAQVRRDSATVKGYWQSIADALASLAPRKQ
jgi:hypothetical protein